MVLNQDSSDANQLDEDDRRGCESLSKSWGSATTPGALALRSPLTTKIVFGLRWESDRYDRQTDLDIGRVVILNYYPHWRSYTAPRSFRASCR